MTVSGTGFPAGFEDFEELRNQGKIYVDKTSFLKDLLSGPVVTMFLRPHLFGKTLSMSMIEKFVEINYANPEERSRQEKLFKDLDVYDDTELCDEYIGRYPVISISLKDVNGADFPEAMKSMLGLLGKLFEKYSFLLDSDKLYDLKRDRFKRMIEICNDENSDLRNIQSDMDKAVSITVDSLYFLSDLLHDEYDREVFIIVDDYDSPLQKAAENNYYDRMLSIIFRMLEDALKGNNNMRQGFLTGCLRIPEPSIYSGFNHYATCEMKNARCAGLIEFTGEETESILKQNGCGRIMKYGIAFYGKGCTVKMAEQEKS